jgi:hypothetical protein
VHEAENSKIDLLFRRILASARESGADQVKEWRNPERDFRRLVERDYVRVLRRHLGYREVKQLYAAVDRLLVRAGGDIIVWGSLEGMRQMAASSSLHFKAEPYEGDEGMALRGFYVDKDPQVLERPLIYVNTAHAPIAVSATFCHEFAHYLTAELIETEPKPVHFFYDGAYASHLDDPVELAADAIVSLRAYPRIVADQFFRTPWDRGLVAKIGGMGDDIFEQVRTYLKDSTGFDFVAGVPALQNMHYLSGMIHYAKLRMALLAEYDL